MSTHQTRPTGRAATTARLLQQSTPPVVHWARLGGAILIFILYVMLRWVLTGKAVPTDPGPDLLPELTRQFIFWVQCITTVLGIAVFWLFVVRPWRREGQLTTTGMLYICWLTLF